MAAVTQTSSFSGSGTLTNPCSTTLEGWFSSSSAGAPSVSWGQISTSSGDGSPSSPLIGSWSPSSDSLELAINPDVSCSTSDVSVYDNGGLTDSEVSGGSTVISNSSTQGLFVYDEGASSPAWAPFSGTASSPYTPVNGSIPTSIADSTYDVLTVNGSTGLSSQTTPTLVFGVVIPSGEPAGTISDTVTVVVTSS
jgi:hypothetical protein